jgi:DNA polymerase-3 subunit delta'
MITFDDIFDQERAVEWLKQSYRADRLPHGLVFAGPAGVGKATTAKALATLFLCENAKSEKPCGKCASCQAMDAAMHPDFHVVTRELIRYHDKTGKSKGITLSIDVIRPELVEPASRKSVLGRGKFFLVEQADLMQAPAQNALLKTLEEPAGRTLIVLLTDQIDCLLPTIRSRSQTIRFSPLGEQTVVRELKKRGIEKSVAEQAARFTNGSLGVALKWIEDGVIEPATQLVNQVDELFEGRAPENLPAWFKKAGEAYAEKQLARDPLGSKDAGTREGLSLYLNLAAEHVRRKLGTLRDADHLERACAAIDAILRAETYLEGNVNTSLVFQQLAATLGRPAICATA